MSKDTAASPVRPVPTAPDLTVIGGGLAGLVAAAVAAEAGKTVIVHEKRSSVGGQARSTIKEGFTLNQGPHALYRGGPAEQVLTELGVQLRGGKPPVKGRIVFDGQAQIAPAGPLTMLRTKALTARDKTQVAAVLARLPRLKAADYATMTVNDWIADSVTRERPAAMLHALVRLATYANQPDQLSAQVAINQLQPALADGVLYLHNGWQSIVDQLASKPGVHVVTGSSPDVLPDSPAVIVATGNPQSTGELLGRTFDVGPPAHASCLDLGLRRRPAHDFVLGGDQPFYYSNHSAVADLAPSGQFHAAAVQYLGQDDEPAPQAIADFVHHAGIYDDDIVLTRQLHRMTTVTALATASHGGFAGRPSVEATGHDNVFIAGDWVGPTGHLADASVASGKAAAHAALASLDSRPSRVA